jgi:hypothetical protein
MTFVGVSLVGADARSSGASLLVFFAPFGSRAFRRAGARYITFAVSYFIFSHTVAAAFASLARMPETVMSVAGLPASTATASRNAFNGIETAIAVSITLMVIGES